MDVLGVELCPQLLQLLVLFLELQGQALDGLLELFAIDTTLAKLCPQFVDEFTVLLHGLLDKLHILGNALRATCTLAVTCHTDAAFSLTDFTQSLLNLIEG